MTGDAAVYEGNRLVAFRLAERRTPGERVTREGATFIVSADGWSLERVQVTTCPPRRTVVRPSVSEALTGLALTAAANILARPRRRRVGRRFMGAARG